jgi:hypothetical protein
MKGTGDTMSAKAKPGLHWREDGAFMIVPNGHILNEWGRIEAEVYELRLGPVLAAAPELLAVALAVDEARNLGIPIPKELHDLALAAIAKAEGKVKP